MTTGAPGRASTRAGLVLLITTVNAALFAFLAFAQWLGWGGIRSVETAPPPAGDAVLMTLYTAAVNFGCAAVFVVLVLGANPAAREWGARLGLAFAGALVVASVRAVALEPVGDPVSLADDVWDWAGSVLAYVAAVVAALVVGDLVARVRAEQEAQVEQVRRVARLELEEALHRRAVADRLHGGVQNQLVVVTARLDAVAAALGGERHPLAEEVEDAAGALERIREEDVRALSHDLFPRGVDASLTRALSTLLDRLPASLGGVLDVDPGYRDERRARGAEPLGLADRVLVVDVVEEAITNALKHGHATAVRVAVGWGPLAAGGRGLRLRITDDGRGTGGQEPVLSGLARLRDRVEARGGSVALGPGERGAVLTCEVPGEQTSG